MFVGPTLPRSDPQLAAPDVRVWPPAGHGDLFDSAIRGEDTVVVIDGVYHQAPALRHKEILAAMGRGVRVIGAASIGALRAAELGPYGMLGVGRVYSAYASGEIDGDDEVAVGQTPDGEWDALTWPVVNLRHVLGLARSAAVLNGGRAARLLAALRAVYYPQRTTAAVQSVCRRQGETEFARWLAEQRKQDRHFGDLKRADALAAIDIALGGRASQAAARTAPAVWETTYFRRWSNAFARTCVDGLDLSTEDRLVYQQVFDPAFHTTWAAYLEHRSLHPADCGPGLPLAERLAQVTGNDLPADRVFHPAIDLRNEATVALLLAGETEMDRQAVARYADALARERQSRPGFSTAAVRDDVTRRLLLRVWQCPEERFDAEASARGLVHGVRAVETAKRLIPGLLDEMAETTERTEVACGGC
ncbi:TfuA-like protein [Streptomyces sp. NPDC046909]|uniref:TfuA-like protein n=1 Tax=Streptomyces sp. NPDC046909 TaxID=3155617 RepID=UPI0033FA1F5C